MERRTRIILGAVLTLIILIVVAVLVWWWLNRTQPTATLTPQPNQPLPQEQLPSASAGAPSETMDEPTARLVTTLRAAAMTFAERFGSYSNQSGYINLDDLKSLMTIRMIAWAENYKAAHPIDQDAPYNGVTTKALSAQVVSLDETIGRANVLVATQRAASQDTTVNPTITYPSLQLSMVREGNIWKIDAAEWQ